MESVQKIKGYQSHKLYITNDIPMGKNTLTSELTSNKQIMKRVASTNEEGNLTITDYNYKELLPQ